MASDAMHGLQDPDSASAEIIEPYNRLCNAFGRASSYAVALNSGN